MKYFVHLKDDVVFAFHQSETEIDVEGDNIIEVDHNGEDYLNKKYTNNTFIDAPIIRYATLDSNNTVVGINTTLFLSEVQNKIIINDNDVDILWTWDGEKFNEPETVNPIEPIWVDSQQVASIVPQLEIGANSDPQEISQEEPTE
jgi:hypothetical protein